MKKDAYYFSHDSNAQDDPKCMNLIDQMGMEGYGIFWALVEKLRAEKEYKLPISVISPLAKRWGTSKEKVETVINNYELFIVENQLFFSLRLINSMKEKSDKARLSANGRWKKNAPALRPHTECNAVGMLSDAIKGKERKVNKEKKSIMGIAPSLTEVKQYFDEKGYSEIADKFYAYYESANWHDAKGNKVKSWKQKAQGVWFRAENKKQENLKGTISSFV